MARPPRRPAAPPRRPGPSAPDPSAPDPSAPDLSAPDLSAPDPSAPDPSAPGSSAPGSSAHDRLALAETLDLTAAGPLAAELAARRGTDLDLDAGRVRRLGAQPLQVLLAARACWWADGAALRVVAPSAAFLDGLALLGAASLLPCTPEEGADARGAADA